MTAKKKRTAWKIGQAYLFRTVTQFIVGKLEAVDDHEFVLSDAAWVADTGRFNEALKTGTVNECEPFPEGPVFIGRGALVDACQWNHTLLRLVK